MIETRKLAVFLGSMACTAPIGSCSGSDGPGGVGELEPLGPAPCAFANPVGSGQDPWVVRHDGSYYLVESRGRAIWVYKSQKLPEIKFATPVRVWQAPQGGWNQHHIWAPELHFIDGRWYIYYAAGSAGPPYIHQRSGVLESAGADPQGSYTDRGMLATRDDLTGSTDNVWAIDLTVTHHRGQLYAVWSGWLENRNTDATAQHLYIATMSNPYTISSGRVLLSSPDTPWEDGQVLDLQEGPQFLARGGDLFIIYSTRESWRRDYRLGQLRLKSSASDLMDPGSWIKSGPVFTASGNVYGPGHASFTTSPDGKEDWIVYHAKSAPADGWDDRRIHMQKFTWHPDGAPNFGTPIPSGQATPAPSGQCG